MNVSETRVIATVECTEPDPTPDALELATTVRRRLADPAVAVLTGSLSGWCDIATRHDPRETRLMVEGGRVKISRSPAGGCSLERGDPAVAAWIKDLVVPVDTPWEESAEEFWKLVDGRPGAPQCLLISPDDGSPTLQLGDVDAEAYEIHGAPSDLHQAFSGRTLLIDAVAAGRLKVVGTLPQLSVLCGVGMDMLIGDWG